MKALRTFFHQRRQVNDYYQNAYSFNRNKCYENLYFKSVFCLFICLFVLMILLPASGKACGKLFSFQFNISFAFYKLLYSEICKNGHSKNKILPTQRTSIADGLSLTNIWHIYFGKKVCSFSFASYCVAAR